LTYSATIGQFNVLVKGQEEEINRLKVTKVYDDWKLQFIKCN